MLSALCSALLFGSGYNQMLRPLCVKFSYQHLKNLRPEIEKGEPSEKSPPSRYRRYSIFDLLDWSTMIYKHTECCFDPFSRKSYKYKFCLTTNSKDSWMELKCSLPVPRRSSRWDVKICVATRAGSFEIHTICKPAICLHCTYGSPRHSGKSRHRTRPTS